MKEKFRILIVEDEALTATFLSLKFKQLGYNPLEPVYTGEESVEKVREGRPDVVLMDIQLAGDMSGIEAAEQIRSFSQIPIIFMTGYDEQELMDEAKHLNPAGYFVKPVDIHSLQEVIEAI